jgi:ppGpp synthetase/RelA/SpoT-type nucleotidyltranferase
LGGIENDGARMSVPSRTKVNKAGKTLRSQTGTFLDQNLALATLQDWRSAHAYPLNTFQGTLRSRLKAIDQSALVAQRLKRTPSIVRKLQREPWLQLAMMQDIGGLRAVVAGLSEVDQLASLYRNPKLSHPLLREDDYISAPKNSGYRGVHLVYKYENPRPTALPFKGLRIELQIRTRLQHAWAMAVETMEMVTREALKASQGSQKWLDFFRVCSSAFAHLEGTVPVPGLDHISQSESYQLVSDLAAELNIQPVLAGYRSAFRVVRQNVSRGAFYFLLELHFPGTGGGFVNITSFPKGEIDQANEAYAKSEKKTEGDGPNHAVLVNASTLKQLDKAYPSYFLDTVIFNNQIDRIRQLVAGTTK